MKVWIVQILQLVQVVQKHLHFPHHHLFPVFVNQEQEVINIAFFLQVLADGVRINKYSIYKWTQFPVSVKPKVFFSHPSFSIDLKDG